MCHTRNHHLLITRTFIESKEEVYLPWSKNDHIFFWNNSIFNGKTQQHISYMLLKMFFHFNVYSISLFEEKIVFLRCLRNDFFDFSEKYCLFASKTYILLSSFKRPIFWFQTWPKSTTFRIWCKKHEKMIFVIPIIFGTKR